MGFWRIFLLGALMAARPMARKTEAFSGRCVDGPDDVVDVLLLYSARSVFLGRSRRSTPLAFSMESGCQGEKGSQNRLSDPEGLS